MSHKTNGLGFLLENQFQEWDHSEISALSLLAQVQQRLRVLSDSESISIERLDKILDLVQDLVVSVQELR